MLHTNYLIVGSSHAGLAAADAIRMQDKEGPLTLVSQENSPPYSPTILPYVVSGRIDPAKVFLRDAAALDRLGVLFMKGSRVTGVNTAERTVTLTTGDSLKYEKALLATGAEPKAPPIPGLQETPFYVLRTLEDAVKLREAVKGVRTALVLGAGLIGMHAAENLARSGIKVIVVEALSQVLPGYFDEEAAKMIERVFSAQGVDTVTGVRVLGVAWSNGTASISLSSGKALSVDLVLVATGVKPRVHFLQGSGVKIDQGILVDERMRTSTAGIWAAGDVAQARDFFDPAKRISATLPNAVDQGRIAGMDMAGDPATKDFTGSIGLNTYKFFGHRAFAAGMSGMSRTDANFEVDQILLPSSFKYQKLVFQDNCLVGALGVNSDLDPGVMVQLIRRRINLEEVKGKFAAAPVEMSRILMSRIWR
jgi:phenylglyoxylate dehydrogenase epsilon subunit